MAVDYSLLPPEEPLPVNPPSRLVWTIVFFVLVLTGVFAALLLWPKNLPTHTWKFWTCLVFFPVGIPTLVVMRRFSHYEGRKLDVALRNEATHEFNDDVFAVASLPLALVGTAYRFSADHVENAVESVRAGSVKLKTQEPIARDGEPAKVRWLAAPEVTLRAGGKEDDRNRQEQVTKWLFNELLDALASQIQALPSRLDLGVHLSVSGGLTHQENETLWNGCWRRHQFRHASVAEPATEPADLMSLDLWLDKVIEARDRQARLIVAVQLHPLLSRSAPAGTAEAGVALLLVPDTLASEHELTRTANLYRPVRGALKESSEALSKTLKWANVAATDIPGGWQTGLNATQAGMFREPAVKLGLTARATDLDQTVGDAGIAAVWLAVACAASSLSGDAASQIILAGQGESVDCAVLLRVPGEKESGSAAARTAVA